MDKLHMIVKPKKRIGIFVDCLKEALGSENLARSDETVKLQREAAMFFSVSKLCTLKGLNYESDKEIYEIPRMLKVMFSGLKSNSSCHVGIPTTQVVAGRVKEIILNDEWWDQVDYIVSFTAHIYEMPRIMDTDRPTLHLVYEMWDEMIEKARQVDIIGGSELELS
ncbi:hypothetical protein CCACVL1_28716 [Corchorus capsularis]|uniref:Uncharacterized protein n=1 Tax=Corchorus capsularis TaxID=210143 RepID=A0A1R3G5J6_COCAP|nr:hypothetical protein CCACVL1_28716 [Corchorus capsularis]